MSDCNSAAADVVAHYMDLMRRGVIPVTPAPETPFVGNERAALMRLQSDTRQGDPVTRERIMDVCNESVVAMDRLAFALAGAIMRGDALEYERNNRGD